LYQLMFVNVGLLYVLYGKQSADANFPNPRMGQTIDSIPDPLHLGHPN